MDSRIHSVVAPEPRGAGYPDALAAVLGEAMRADARVVLLGEAVGRQGGALGASRGLLDAFGPQRVIDTPIAEDGLLGLAFGMALGGKRPVVELVGPSARIWAQLAREIASVAERSRGEFTAPVVIRVHYGALPGHPRAYDDEPSGRLTLAALSTVAGLVVACPSSPADAVGMLREALEAKGPVVLLEPRSLLGASAGDAAPLPLGRARLSRPGAGLTLLCWGEGVAAAEAAIAALGAEATPELLDLRGLSPLDEAAIAASVRRTGRVIVVDDLYGAEASVAGQRALLLATQAAFLYLEAPPLVVPAEPGRIAAEVLASLRF